ncbi:hypothetical protein WKW77_30665 [Variovorax ureilyticus]|uniref:Uncharacterized protein n=1 Tax=Variovorax ureilyticus TaxID=1836198 RepID=A0ABU8VQN4_9BURK
MRTPYDPLNGVGQRDFGAPPTHAVDSLDTLRGYVGPQPEQMAAIDADPMNTSAYWLKRGQQEQVIQAKETFVRFTAMLNAMNIPASAEAQLRDELLSVLGGHGYTAAG